MGGVIVLLTCVAFAITTGTAEVETERSSDPDKLGFQKPLLDTGAFKPPEFGFTGIFSNIKDPPKTIQEFASLNKKEERNDDGRKRSLTESEIEKLKQEKLEREKKHHEKVHREEQERLRREEAERRKEEERRRKKREAEERRRRKQKEKERRQKELRKLRRKRRNMPKCRGSKKGSCPAGKWCVGRKGDYVCMKPMKVGQPCFDITWRCDKGLRCVGKGKRSYCAKKPQPLCRGKVKGRCTRGRWCVKKKKNTYVCRKPRNLNEPCDNSTMRCGPRLRCVGQKGKKKGRCRKSQRATKLSKKKRGIGRGGNSKELDDLYNPADNNEWKGNSVIETLGHSHTVFD